jgi:hypothetical protein
MYATCPTHLILFDLITLIVGKEYTFSSFFILLYLLFCAIFQHAMFCVHVLECM